MHRLTCSVLVLSLAVVCRSAAAYWPTNSCADRRFVEQVLRGRGSPLLSDERQLYTSAFTWNVDPRFIIAISYAESGYATDGSDCVVLHQNPFGWGGGWPNCKDYSNSGGFNAAIEADTSGIRRLYLAAGYTTVADFVNKGHYCVGDCGNWITYVTNGYASLGGNPNGADFSFGGDCCFGDCLFDGAVTVDEIITIIDVALGYLVPDSCRDGLNAETKTAQIVEIMRAVNNAILPPPGCIHPFF